MRMLAMAAIGLGSALLIVPMMILSDARDASAADAQAAETRKFRAYLEGDWKRWMQECPDVAAQVGYPGQNDRWTDDSPAGIDRRKEHLAESIAELKSIHRDALPESEKL